LVRGVDDEPSHAVDLRLAGESVGLGDRGAERTQAGVADELRCHIWEHGRIVP
jgi:hypothetical protein